MPPFQVVLKHSPDLGSPNFMWSFIKHGYEGRTVTIQLVNYHIRWRDGSHQQYPQCPLRIDFSSPPGEPEKIETLMFGENVGQSGSQAYSWNNTVYNNDRLGFFIPNGDHGSDPTPGFTSLTYAPMTWRARLLAKDIYCSVTLDTNQPWNGDQPDAPGTPCDDIVNNILYIILTFDITLVQ